MSQIPASILVLAASIFSLAAHAASAGSSRQGAVMLTLAAIGIGLWGTISLVAATMKEREMLVDSQARLDMLDQILEQGPLKTLSKATSRAARKVVGRREEPSETIKLSREMQDHLSTVAEISGRDQNELLEEALRRNLSGGQSRVA